MSKNYLRDWEDGRDIDEPTVAPIPKNVRQTREKIVDGVKNDIQRRRAQKEKARWGDNLK